MDENLKESFTTKQNKQINVRLQKNRIYLILSQNRILILINYIIKK